MPYLIAETCVDAQDLSRIEESPIDCICDGAQCNINQNECIEWGTREFGPPVTATCSAPSLPSRWHPYLDYGRKIFFAAGGDPASGRHGKSGRRPVNASTVAASAT